MGGSSVTEDDWEIASNNDAITLVLIGKLGYGKSATGNSILGRKVFKSKLCMTSVTSTCQMESTIINGRTVNVIDTPGLFDSSVGSEEIGMEIVKCVNLAKDGIHALIMVFSIRSLFSEEEQTTLGRLKMFFGERIVDYMILVFTGGDDLEEDETFSFMDYLSCQVPEPAQTIIRICKNRVVLFNNKSDYVYVKNSQVQELLAYVDSVVTYNGGKPFSDEIFQELKQWALKLHNREKDIDKMKGYTAEQIANLKKENYESFNDQLARISGMVEQKLNSTIERLEKELAAEQAARLKADDEIRKLKEQAEKQYKEQAEKQAKIHKLKEDLARAQQEAKDLERNKCHIL